MENNNAEKIFCPLTKNCCIKKSCGWFVLGTNECAVNLLAQCTEMTSDNVSNFVSNYNYED
jgi:hypothetical protein